MHPFETELALYASGDLHGWERVKTALHVRGCQSCQTSLAAFRTDQAQLRDSADALPVGVNWDRLAAEMSANIRVGLAAGECVAPAVREPASSIWNWKPVSAFAGLVMVFGAAWWLNMPPLNISGADDRGPVLEASSEGVEFRENGSSLGVSTSNARPVATSVSFGGSASARYVDDDTGQVTITTVYVP
jgi:hypothetical protein